MEGGGRDRDREEEGERGRMRGINILPADIFLNMYVCMYI